MSKNTSPALLIFLIGMVVIHAALLWSVRDRLRAGYQDFTIFYTAGRIISEGGAARLYDAGLQLRVQRTAVPAAPSSLLPYNHPPFEAVIFAPLSKLKFFPAYLLWISINLLALAGTVMLLRRYLPAVKAAGWPFSILTALAFFPVFTALFQGQDVVLLLLLFASVFSSLKRNSEFAAGCWLGLGLFRFQVVLPFALILLLRYAWPLAKASTAGWGRARRLGGASGLFVGFATTGAILGLLSILCVGWKEMLAYPKYILRVENVTVSPVALGNMPNLRGLIAGVLASKFPEIAVGLTVVLSIAILLFSAESWRNDPSPSHLDLRFSMALIASLLVSYHCYDYDLTLLLIPVLLIGDRYQSGNLAYRWRLLAPMAVLFLTPLHIILGSRYGLLSLLTVVLLFWLTAIAKELSRTAQHMHAKA